MAKIQFLGLAKAKITTWEKALWAQAPGCEQKAENPYTLFPKRNTTLISGFLWGPWTRVGYPGSCPPREGALWKRHLAKISLTYTPPKKKGKLIKKSCVSFGEECSDQVYPTIRFTRLDPTMSKNLKFKKKYKWLPHYQSWGLQVYLCRYSIYFLWLLFTLG